MIKWELAEAVLGPEARRAFSSLDSVYALEGERLSGSLVSNVVRLTLDGRRYYVKRYFAGARNAVRGRLGMTRIESEWRNLRRFADWGIPTAEIVACGLERRHRRFIRGAMITAEIPHTHDLASLARGGDARFHDRQWVCTIIQSVARDTRVMHDHRFAHNDLKWRNILVNDDDPPRTHWIDCPDGMFWWGPFLRYRIVKDLACLDKMAKRHLSRSDRLRFYLSYAKKQRLGDADKQQIRKILHFFAGRE